MTNEYRINQLSDFEKLLAFWRGKSHRHPVFVEVKKYYKELVGPRTYREPKSPYVAKLTFYSPLYRATCCVDIETPEQIDGLVSEKMRSVNHLIHLVRAF